MNEIEWYIPSAPSLRYWAYVKVNGIIYWVKYTEVTRCDSNALTKITEKEAATLQDYRELKQHALKLTSDLYQELVK